MKKIITLCLAIMIAMTLMPSMAFAEDVTGAAGNVKDADSRLVKTSSLQEAVYHSNTKPTVTISDTISSDENSKAYSVKIQFVPNSGDTITVENTTYTWEEVDGGRFASGTDFLYLDYVNFNAANSGVYADVSRKTTETMETYARFTLTNDKYNIVNSVQEISFSPNEISIDAEKAYRENWGKDKYTGYVIYGRNDNGSFFSEGDTLFVKYTDSTSRTFTYKSDIGYFLDGDICLLDIPITNEWKLVPGSNTIRLSWHGLTAPVNVKLEGEHKETVDPSKDTPSQTSGPAKDKAAEKAAASNINKATVSASDIRRASNLGATSVTLGAKVKKLSPKAFKGTNIRTVTIKTKKLKASKVKNSLKGSKVSTIKVKVGNKKTNKTYVKKYKKIFTKKNAGKKVVVK